MHKRIFCKKHYRRVVEYIPVLVPVFYETNVDFIEVRKDLEYKLMCPICWEVEQLKSKK